MPEFNSQDGVSIVVCCYNSAKRLPQTLKYLSQQQCPSTLLLEVILIDNASKDDTQIVARDEWQKNGAPFPLIVVEELQAGLSFARERGIQEAHYEYIIFCDDDNWLASDYISVAYETISTNPSVGVLAGRNIAVSDAELPHWFSTYQVYYAVGVLDLRPGDVSHRGEIWGAGMVFRKSDFLKLKLAGFSPMLTDRKGNVLTSGGDSEICKWYLIIGKKLWYDDRLSLWHFMEENRLHPEYLEELKRMYTYPRLILNRYDTILNFTKNSPKSIFSKGIKFFKHLIKIIYLPKDSVFYIESSSYLEMMNSLPFLLFDHETRRIKNSIIKFHNNNG